MKKIILLILVLFVIMGNAQAQQNTNINGNSQAQQNTNINGNAQLQQNTNGNPQAQQNTNINGNAQVKQDTIKQYLDSNWTLQVLQGPSQAQNIIGHQYIVSLPTTLHLDLLKNQVIEDPFFSANYPTVQWVSNCKIKYTKTLTIQDDALKRKEIQLVFQGIDTYSTILLNGQQLQKTSNAFQQYVIDIKGKLKNTNKIQVIIEPTAAYDNQQQQKNNMPFKYAHTRKACYQYSWDWAPLLNTLGIWKSVYLRLYDQVRFDYVWVRNKVLSNQQAIINFAAKFKTNPYGQKIKGRHKMEVYLDDKLLKYVKINQTTAYLDITIRQPKLWWPNGIGEPHMYQFVVKILKQQNVIEQKKIPYGIRTVQLNLIDKKFQVYVNGYAIYCKGANYVPPDMFYPRLSNQQHNPPNSIQKLIDDAVQSNFNMLRVWGGGQYESDEFLQLASRKGIMIFYDFMFSDSIYPSTQEFLISVEDQIKQQIRRARNYPCLTIWCGNNQILQGINDWGWSRSQYRNDYKLLFQTLIKRVVQIQSAYIPYIPSSPIYGVGNYGFDRGGDIHYWGVWAGGSPFQSYQSAYGPFNSQFGTQGLPVWQTIKQFTKQDQRSYEANGFALHERHGSRFSTLRNYIKMYMKPSFDFEKQAYISGLVQAYGIQIAIKTQRTVKPKSYGTLYWQFNDAWPAISWSSIDYYGRWKPLQYMAKRTYTNIAVFCVKNDVIIVNDNLYEVNVTVNVKIMTFKGEILSDSVVSKKVNADTTQLVTKLRIKQQMYPIDEQFVYCQVLNGEKLQMKTTYFFKSFKQLPLPKATLKVGYNVQNNQIKLQSQYLIKNLYIYNANEYIKLDDNYFDLIPNIPVTVKLQNSQLADLKQTMKYMSVRQASLQQQLQVQQ